MFQDLDPDSISPQVVTGRRSGERQVRKAPSAAERLEQLRSEATSSSGVLGGAAAAVAAGAQRVQRSFTHGWAFRVYVGFQTVFNCCSHCPQLPHRLLRASAASKLHYMLACKFPQAGVDVTPAAAATGPVAQVSAATCS